MEQEREPAGGWKATLRTRARFCELLAIVTAIAAFAACPAAADDAGTSPGSAHNGLDDWSFRAAAYGWLLNVSGNVTARGQTADVNASFLQLVQKSDSMGALMGYFEADKGKMGFYTDVVWANLGFSKSMTAYRNPLPGVTISAAANAALTYSMTIVEAGGVYEVARWPGSEGSFTAVDGLLGFRYWNNSVDLNLDVTGSANVAPLGLERTANFAIARSGSLNWVDPVVGVRMRHQFTPSQELTVRGDIGGFGLQNRFAWQALAVYSYSWQVSSYRLSGVVGYRALAVDATGGSGLSDNGANLVLHGPIIGFAVKF
jgi:hypothetical protein